MTLTENLLYSGPSHPGEDTLFPADLNPYKRSQFEFMNAHADAASDLMIGCICLLTGGTQANDMTATAAITGTTSQNSLLFIVQPDKHSNYFAYSTTFLTNVPPNESITASSYQYPADAKIKVALLEEGDIFWGLVSTNGTGSVTMGNDYVPAQYGLWAATGDPDGTAIDEVSHSATAIATTSNQNWGLFIYHHREVHDKTA